MEGFGALSLVPAAVTIAVALFSRRIAVALAAGTAAGALVAGRLSPLATGEAAFKALSAPLRDLERLEIIGFILLVGGLLEVLRSAGAFAALADALERRLQTARKTRLAAWALSMCLFFDDYANVLITGSAMRRIAPRHGMSRAMLAYVIDVVAVLASVMLVSTWAAFEGGVMAESAQALGRSEGAAELFLGSLPYHFYTYLAIALTLLSAASGRWIGARLDTEAGAEPQEPPVVGKGARAAHVVTPLACLVGGAIVAIAVVGTIRVLVVGGPLTPMRVVASAPTVLVLIGATLVATGVAVAMLRRSGVLTGSALRGAFQQGLKSMAPVALIIALATALSAVSTDLGSGPFLAGAFTRALPAPLLPCAVYVAAMLVTVATGFSWGSMAILMPVAYQIALGPGLGPEAPAGHGRSGHHRRRLRRAPHPLLGEGRAHVLRLRHHAGLPPEDSAAALAAGVRGRGGGVRVAGLWGAGAGGVRGGAGGGGVGVARAAATGGGRAGCGRAASVAALGHASRLAHAVEALGEAALALEGLGQR
ncbi:MAG: Na+/H+ antiporter NhaC family protein [Myxococcales bacterium]